MRCPECGYEMKDEPTGSCCPECGVASTQASRLPEAGEGRRGLLLRFAWPFAAGTALVCASAMDASKTRSEGLLLLALLLLICIGPGYAMVLTARVLARQPRRVRQARFVPLVPVRIGLPIAVGLGGMVLGILIAMAAALLDRR